MANQLLRVNSRIYRGAFDTPKNGKPREVALSDGTLRALAELKQVALDPEGFIFASEARDMEVYTISDLQQKRQAVKKLESAVIRNQKQKQSA